MGKSAPKPQDAKPQSTRGPARPGSSAPAAASAATSSSGSGGGGIRDRSKCVLLKRDGDDVKTATYICGGCGAQLAGFTAWRNHLKKSTRFKKFQELGAKVHSKRRLSMRPADKPNK